MISKNHTVENSRQSDYLKKKITRKKRKDGRETFKRVFKTCQPITKYKSYFDSDTVNL